MQAPDGVLHFQARMSVNLISRQVCSHNFISGLCKYSENVYEAFIRSFCALPLAGLVDGELFCVHGGLSPQLMSLRDIDDVSSLSGFWSTPQYLYIQDQQMV
jgi:hypothetical protein